MKFQVTIFTFILALCCGSKNDPLKKPVKRSEITIPKLMDNIIAKDQKFLHQSLNEMLATSADFASSRNDFNKQINLMKLFHQRLSIPKMKARKTATHFTEAHVNVLTCHGLINADCNLRVSGKFGYHSPHKMIQGRLIHILDKEQGKSHFGCTKEIANGQRSGTEPWIALIARGKCRFLEKIKLAERYNASAVIIYNRKNGSQPDIMHTPGTKITSLMVNYSSGQKLIELSQTSTPLFAKISVGRINIFTTDIPPVEKPQPVKVTIHFQTKEDGPATTLINNVSGAIGIRSPKKSVSGELIHIRDFNSATHLGCYGRISIEEETSLPHDKWIALIARGECNTLVKVKLAEKYHASAVILYNRNFLEEEESVMAVGAQIPTLVLGVSEGRKILEVLQKKESVYVDVTVDRQQSTIKEWSQEEHNSRGCATTKSISLRTVIFSTVIVIYCRLLS